MNPTMLRVLSRIRFDVHTGCWNWLGARKSDGYGSIGVGGTTTTTHRLAYEQFRGVVEPGLELDHLCRNRGCCNPWHLEAVTHRENMRRGDVGKYQAAKTVCDNGHPFDEVNTYRHPNGTRKCRECQRRACRDWYARKVAREQAQPA